MGTTQISQLITYLQGEGKKRWGDGERGEEIGKMGRGRREREEEGEETGRVKGEKEVGRGRQLLWM